MAHSEDVDERIKAAEQLQLNFADLPDKDAAWKDILALTKDVDINVRMWAVTFISIVFPHVIDKDQAWKDLLEQIKYVDEIVKIVLVSSLEHAIPHVTDNKQASKDLITLTKKDNVGVRKGVTSALGSAFPHVTDKDKTSKALIELTKDGSNDVRMLAASSIGSAFPHITDKDQASKALIELTYDEDEEVRSHANHAMGQIYILKATETKSSEGLRNDLEKALKYFEESTKEGFFYPARFCLPFYRSFHTITFKKDDAETEIKKSIEEAKQAVGFSKNKYKLLEAIENLSNALIEAQKAGKIGLDAKQSDLKAWKSYCDKTEAILKTTQDNAPVATRMLEMGVPIVVQRIDEIIYEIREKAKSLLEATENTGTPYESPSAKIERCSQQLSDTDTEKSKNLIPHITKNLNELCKQLPDDKKGVACDLIRELEGESEYKDMLVSIRQILFYLVPNIKKAVSEGNEQKPLNRIVLEVGALLITIATPVSGYFYAKFDKMGHSFALEESLVIFGLFFILILVFYSIEKK